MNETEKELLTSELKFLADKHNITLVAFAGKDLSVQKFGVGDDHIKEGLEEILTLLFIKQMSKTITEATTALLT